MNRRILPRLMLLAFIVMTCWAAYWFMYQSDGTGQDVAFVGTLWGAGAAAVYKFWTWRPKQGGEK